MKIEVLGSGCKKCVSTAELIESVVKDMGAAATVEKVTDPAVMMQHRIMATPAVVIDGKLVHSGSMPKAEQIQAWLK